MGVRARSEDTRTQSRNTREVLEAHLRLRSQGDLERDLAENYSPEVTLLTRSGVYQGRDKIREQAEILDSYADHVTYGFRELIVSGPMAYLEWEAGEAGDEIRDGADSYLVRNGRIEMQTIHYSPRSAEDWPNRRREAPEAILLYDAECPFCRWSAGMLLAWDRQRRLAPLALQNPAAINALPDLSAEQRMQTWHLITPDGDRHSGGAAFAPLFAMLPGGMPLSRLAGRFPRAASRLYDTVSEHRDKLVKLIPRQLQSYAARRIQERTADSES